MFISVPVYRDHIGTPLTRFKSPLRTSTTSLELDLHWTEVTYKAQCYHQQHRKSKFINMSVTTTANPATQTVFRLLADYELKHSGDEDLAPQNIGTLNPRPAPDVQNPEGWTDNYNGVPPYRPINYNLDREQRPWGRPGAETPFVMVMLNGVGVVAVSRGRMCDRLH